MRWRLLLAFLGVMGVMLVAQDVPLAPYLRQVEHDRQLADLERDAFILAGQAAVVLRPEEGATVSPDALAVDALADTAAGYATREQRDVTILDDAGVVVVAATGADDDLADAVAVGSVAGREADVAAALGGESAAGVTPDVVSVAVPVLSGASTIGVVRVSSPAWVIDERARSRVRGLVVVAVISLVAAAAVAMLIARSVTGPLRRLQVGTERVAAGHFGERVDEREGPAEVRRLARSFNAMTERIAKLVARQRTFAGDASHQLRTPLTALRLQLERTAALLDDDAEGARRNLKQPKPKRCACSDSSTGCSSSLATTTRWYPEHPSMSPPSWSIGCRRGSRWPRSKASRSRRGATTPVGPRPWPPTAPWSK